MTLAALNTSFHINLGRFVSDEHVLFKNWKVVKNENTSSEFFSNNLCLINSAPSKDGGTYKRELNERESKMHNLKTKPL
jgi:hypothetical protein